MKVELVALSKRFVLAAVLFGLILANSALGMPLSNQTFQGGNNLLGEGAGLQENYISANPGDYRAVNLAANFPGGSMPGMTESFRVDWSGRSGSFTDGIQGINLPSPGTVPLSDFRSEISNPLAGGVPLWNARAGVIIRWVTNSADPGPGGPFALLPFGSTTSQAYNLTPKVIHPISSLAVDDGLAPGSMPMDNIPDFLPFVLDFAGRRVASLNISFFDEMDGPALFGGLTPTALIPRIDLVEDDGIGTLVEPSSAPLNEDNFDFNDGNIGDLTGGHIDRHVDGTIALTGRVLNTSATLTWLETARHSGTFELDIEYTGDIIYDGGLLFDAFGATIGDFNMEWAGIEVMDSVDGIYESVGEYGVNQDGVLVDVTELLPGEVDAGGEEFLRDLISHSYASDYDFEDSSSASQTFNISVDIIPEPLTASTALLSLGSLGLMLGRRR